MSLPISYYVNVTSGVGAAETIPQRQLIPLFFDDNVLIPSGGYVNFPNNSDGAANVAAYFGSESEEYARALFAFGWVSKNITVVPSISFARWNSSACAPIIYGDTGTTTKTVGGWTAVTSGAFSLTMGTTSHDFTGLDFSAVATLADVANIIQGSIQAITGGGALWTAATVAYDSTSGEFRLTGGATGAAVISVTAGPSNDIAGKLGWLGVTAIFGPGAGVQTITEALNTIAALNNNFGSFTFMAELTTDQITEAATVNNAYNETFLYSVPVTADTATTIQTAIGDIGGCTVTLLHPTLTQYEEQIPMMIMGATNYNNLNSTQNYMFNQFDIQPSVTDVTTALAYDAIGVNYYANTQQSGTIVNLYQRGIMNGLSVDAASQNTYANEVWLKGAMVSALFTLLLTLNKISANNAGQAQVMAICQSVITAALNNGTIIAGRTLTPAQISYVVNATGQQNSWLTIQSIGYILSTKITTEVVDSKMQYIINYSLIYASDQVVNKITGTDIQI